MQRGTIIQDHRKSTMKMENKVNITVERNTVVVAQFFLELLRLFSS
jgi:hypothetical protein